MACANLINLLQPEAIVIGGGVMASGDLLLDAAREEVAAPRIPCIRARLSDSTITAVAGRRNDRRCNAGTRQLLRNALIPHS